MMSTTRPLGDYFNCCHENSREIYKVYLDYLFASTVESRFFEPSVLRASWSYWNQVFSWALSNQISLGEACRKRYKTPAIAQSNVALSILYDISVTEYVPDFRRFSVWPLRRIVLRYTRVFRWSCFPLQCCFCRQNFSLIPLISLPIRFVTICWASTVNFICVLVVKSVEITPTLLAVGSHVDLPCVWRASEIWLPRLGGLLVAAAFTWRKLAPSKRRLHGPADRVLAALVRYSA